MLSMDSSKCIWTGGGTCPQLVTYPSSPDRVSFVFQFAQIPSLLRQSGLVDLVLQILSVHQLMIDVFQRTSRSRNELLGRKNLWVARDLGS